LNNEIDFIRGYELPDGFGAVCIIHVNGASEADGAIFATHNVSQIEIAVTADMVAPSGSVSKVIGHFR
jgi:hypothetical protein